MLETKHTFASVDLVYEMFEQYYINFHCFDFLLWLSRNIYFSYFSLRFKDNHKIRLFVLFLFGNYGKCTLSIKVRYIRTLFHSSSSLWCTQVQTIIEITQIKSTIDWLSERITIVEWRNCHEKPNNNIGKYRVPIRPTFPLTKRFFFTLSFNCMRFISVCLCQNIACESSIYSVFFTNFGLVITFAYIFSQNA